MAQSVLWDTAIGLAKLEGEEHQIMDRFTTAMASLRVQSAEYTEKVMAAEMIASINADIEALTDAVIKMEQELRSSANVPEEDALGVAAILLSGRKPDGSYPIEEFITFKRQTESYKAAAILAISNMPTTFQDFRSLLYSWGHGSSEDLELASAYLAASNIAMEDAKPKLPTILQVLRNDLEYPLVAAAMLATMPLSATESLDLMEKALSILERVTTGLGRAELVSLAIRMIQGDKNIRPDSTAKAKTVTTEPQQRIGRPMYTPVLFTRPMFFYPYPVYVGGTVPAGSVPTPVRPSPPTGQPPSIVTSTAQAANTFVSGAERAASGVVSSVSNAANYFASSVAHSAHYAIYSVTGGPHAGHTHAVGGFSG